MLGLLPLLSVGVDPTGWPSRPEPSKGWPFGTEAVGAGRSNAQFSLENSAHPLYFPQMPSRFESAEALKEWLSLEDVLVPIESWRDPQVTHSPRIGCRPSSRLLPECMLMTAALIQHSSACIHLHIHQHLHQQRCMSTFTRTCIGTDSSAHSSAHSSKPTHTPQTRTPQPSPSPSPKTCRPPCPHIASFWPKTRRPPCPPHFGPKRVAPLVRLILAQNALPPLSPYSPPPQNAPQDFEDLWEKLEMGELELKTLTKGSPPPNPPLTPANPH